MPSHESSKESVESHDAILLTLKNQEGRIAKLEDTAQKTLFSKMTAIASATALFLGLGLTSVSLYDAFVTKPESDRIGRLSQFNEAINAEAKAGADLTKSQFQTTDPQTQFVVIGKARAMMLNEISIARAMLRDLNSRDVDIPPLIFLISESLTLGDLDSAKEFVKFAVNKPNTSPFMRSEAKRYEGKYLFASGDPIRGRESYKVALTALGSSPALASARAYDLSDLVISEYSQGDCKSAAADLQNLAAALTAPGVTAEAGSQMGAWVRAQLQGQPCPTLQNLDTLLSK
jgi:hypothetical protein